VIKVTAQTHPFWQKITPFKGTFSCTLCKICMSFIQIHAAAYDLYSKVHVLAHPVIPILHESQIEVNQFPPK
jgi:hypothetical protein